MIRQIVRRFTRRFFKEDSGQALPVLAFMMIIFMGMAGISIDVGRMYFFHAELQAATDAAALAGAGTLPNSTAGTVATSYSAVSGNKNTYANMVGVSMVSGYPQLLCLNSLKSAGQACTSPGNANAVRVKQQYTVKLFFMALLGRPSMVITATATSSMRGAARSPYNVIIIVDTTGSMGTYDSDSNCADSRLNCALAGVQVLLQNLSPCGSSQSSCGTVTNGNVANAVDKVSIYTFPGVTAATASNDYDCGGSVTTQAYTYPTLPTYQIVPFSSDYRTSTTASSLNTTSNLVHAAGGKSGCSGLQNPGGYGTYYAGVIYAAQASLVSAQVSGTQNVMILLSDGDSTASSSQMTSNNNGGIYPSVVNQCQQAVAAAAAATAAGTRIYAVAYGAGSSGCSSDTKGNQPGITPCQTMQQIASASQYFYSDYTAAANNGSCISASQPTSSLNQIFVQIAGDLSVSRLIPDNIT